MAKLDAVTFALVPAGPTEWDLAGRITGAADLPLSQEGRARAASAAEEVARRDVAVVLHAGDDASVETARVLAAKTGARTRLVEDLAEVSLGLWEGLARSEFVEKFPTAARQWSEDPASVVPPEGESLSAADERIIAGLARALERAKVNGAGVAVVLRPVALGLVRCWLRGLPSSEVWQTAEDAPIVEWRTIPRSDLRGVRTRTSA